MTKSIRIPLLTLVLVFGISPLSRADTFWVRPADGGTGDGASYARAWRGFSAIDWSRFAPGDTLFLCGTHIDSLFTLPWDPALPEGTPRAPIVIDGACLGDDGTKDPGRLAASPAAPSDPFGISTMRRDHFTFRNLSLQGYAVLVLDSFGTLFQNVTIEDAPDNSLTRGAIEDRGLATVYDGVRILNSAREAISQDGRGHNPFRLPASTTIWSDRRASFLQKRDFQQGAASTVIRDSVIDTTGRREDYLGHHAIDLFWNKSVRIENTRILFPGGSGIRIHTDDASANYGVDDGPAGCPADCSATAGYACQTSATQPSSIPPEVCLHTATDTVDVRDPFDLGTDGIHPEITIRGSTLRASYQEGAKAQCAYASGHACGASDPCPFGYVCDGGSCTRGLAQGQSCGAGSPCPGGYSCVEAKCRKPDCGNQHYGIVVAPGSPFTGRLVIEDNEIAGFAGNGILVESLWDREPGSPGGPTIAIRGNDISGSGHWGIWLGAHGSTYPTGSVVVESNRIHHNGSPFQLWAHGGVQLNSVAANVLVDNNYIYRNGSRETALPYHGKFGGLVIASAPNGFAPRRIEVTRNTFVDNHTTNLMTQYLTPATVTDPATRLGVRRNLSVFTSRFARETSRRGVHVGWRVTPAGATPPGAPEWLWLDHNLYFSERLPFLADSRSFSIEHSVFGSLGDYREAVGSFEAGTVGLDPALDANLQPQNPDAAAYGASPP